MTKSEFLAKSELYDPQRKNRAIQAHMEEIRAMTEAEFQVHYLYLKLQARRPERAVAVKRMVSEALRSI